ncbi:hypothetical protein [Nonomuraea aridisoli]|uniref:Uncharacterized protein n=1 Tax=Nonomuraea aridisoli TaxID=2070368 RepID=A0A2W2G6P6_9ACTN|nr:hypothetical protein [Nonomuraea aridisoli]PZG22524.1 hypothetical protein C1J01_03805 [Nonomuraea aridisoli]
MSPEVRDLAWAGAAARGQSISLYLETLVEADPLTRGQVTGAMPRRLRVPTGTEVMLQARVRPEVCDLAKKGAKARRVPLWRYLEILVEADQKGTAPVEPEQTEQLNLDLMSA